MAWVEVVTRSLQTSDGFAPRQKFWLNEEDDRIAIEMWGHCSLLQVLAEMIHDVSPHVSINVPDGRGVLRTWVSSSRDELSKNSLVLYPVAPGSLAGGAATAAEASLANDKPKASTNSNHFEEGQPTGYLSIPIQVEKNPLHAPGLLGDVFLRIDKRTDKFSFEHKPNNALFYCFAHLIQHELGRHEAGTTPWFAGLFKVLDRQALEDQLTALEDLGGTNDQQRYVWAMISVVQDKSPDVDEDVNRVLCNLAEDRALRRAYPYPVFKFDEGTYIIARFDLNEVEWWKLRDQPISVLGPVEVWSAVGRTSPPPMIVGSIQEFRITWMKNALDDAKDAWGKRELHEHIIKQFQFARDHMDELNLLRRLYRDSNYKQALQIADSLATNMSWSGGMVSNDLSRLALHCRHYQEAARYARMRMTFAEWEPTPHANLLLAYMAGGRLDMAIQHAEDCKRCTAHCTLTIGSTEDDPNSLLTVGLALITLAGNSPCSKKKWISTRLPAALQSLAPNSEAVNRLIVRSLLEAFNPTSGDPFNSDRDLFRKLIWDLDVSRPSEGSSWREWDALRRVLLAATGAGLATLPNVTQERHTFD